MSKKVLYISGAPAVSTNDQALTSGPRAHILGVIKAFEYYGWKVKKEIFGDKIPFTTQKNYKSKKLPMVLGDLSRILLGLYNGISSRDGSVDLIYERNAVFQSIGIFSKNRTNLWIVESNGVFYKEAKDDRKSIKLSYLAFVIEKFSYEKCDIIVTVTETLKQEIIMNFKVDPKKIIVIPNGVDVERFESLDRIEYINKETKTIGYVGSVIEWQGLEHLIQSVSDAETEANALLFDLVIAGDGPALEDLKMAVSRLGLKDRVKFPGHVPWSEIPNLIKSFDICFSGQIDLKGLKMYHSPLKIYEYMASAKPIIMSSHEDALSIMSIGDIGYLFDPSDTSSLKQILLKAHTDHQNWPEKGIVARDIAHREFSWFKRYEKIRKMVEDETRKN